jgi:hypothetical protein
MSDAIETKAAEVVETKPEAEKAPTAMEVHITMDLISGNVNVRTNCMLVNGLGLLEMAKTALQDNNKRQAAMEAARKQAAAIIPVGKDAVANLEHAGLLRKPS